MINLVKFDDLQKPFNASLYRCLLFLTRKLNNKLEDVDCWVAGGFFRAYFAKEKIDDIDIFTTNRSECAKLIWRLRLLGWKPYYKNANALKGGFNDVKGNYIKVDVVKRFYTTPQECIKDFDFSVSKFALHLKNKYIIYNNSFFPDLCTKRLTLPDESFSNAIGSLKRLHKFSHKGYKACNGTLLQLAKKISEVQSDDPQLTNLEYYPDGNPRIILFD